jgi:hypothetical protein
VEKQYELSGCSIKVYFFPRIIKIEGANALKRFLSTNIEARSQLLVNRIKVDYVACFNKELKVGNNSMIIEIWGHVYASRLAKGLKNRISLKLIQKLTALVIKRSDNIDSGEFGIDHNRIFWDLLSHLKKLILMIMPHQIKGARS